MPVDLYIVRADQGVKELNVIAKSKVKDNLGAKTTINWVEKLWEAGEQARVTNDDEKEYILKLAMIETLVAFRKSVEYKKDKKPYSKNMERLIPSLERIELLQEGLEIRYNDILEEKAIIESIKDEDFRRSAESKKENTLRLTEDLEAILNKNPTGIVPKDLIELVKTHGKQMADAGGIMILDIRARACFNRNRMTFLQKWPHHPDLVHIPIENVSGEQSIGTKLANNSLFPSSFGRRHQCRLIVLLSEKSSTTDLLSPMNPVLNTFKALTEFDSPTLCEKSRIRVLDGGLHEWKSLYNFMMTDPTETPPKANFIESDIMRCADEVNYDSVTEILNPKPKPKPAPKVKKEDPKPVPIVTKEDPQPATKRPGEPSIPAVLADNPELKKTVDRLAELEAKIPPTPVAPLESTSNKYRKQVEEHETSHKLNEKKDLSKRKEKKYADKYAEKPPTKPKIIDAQPERPTAPKPIKTTTTTKVVGEPKVSREDKPKKAKVFNREDSKETRLTPQQNYLPDDYEKKFDSKTNRFYYLNHNDRTTSWSAPDGLSDPDIPERPSIPRPRKSTITDMECLHPVHGSNERGTTGLRNLGNTCYMNSVIQSLGSLKPLVDKFLSDSFRSDINRNNFLGHKGVIAENFALLVKGLWAGTYKNMKPDMFKAALASCNPIFGNYKQQDAQELLIFLLDGLHEDLNKVKERRYIEEKDANGRPDQVVAEESWENHTRLNKSIIVDMFQGQFRATLKCLSCKFTSVKFDAFMFLSLPIPSSGKVSLEDCLDLFQQTERLTGHDRWTCPQCKKPRDAERTLRLWRLPQLLIIHLKRFKSDGRWKSKIQTNVQFLTKGFDLKRQTLGSRHQPPYHLIAVTHHIGASTDSGHYVASCRRTNGWVNADDSDVTRIRESQVVSPTAYILFYSSRPYDSDPVAAIQF